MAPFALTLSLPEGWEVSVFADEISPDIDVQLEEVSRAGLRWFDFRSAANKNVLDYSDSEVAEIQQKAEAKGLGVLCIGSPINKHPYRREGRVRELERLKRIAEIAHRLSAPYVRIFTPLLSGTVAVAQTPLNLGTDQPSGEAAAPVFEEIRDWMLDQAEFARQADVILLMENDGDAYAAFPENARRLLENLPGDHLKAVYDFSNAVLLGYPALPHWFPWILPYLGGIHIKDSLLARAENGDEQIVPAGRGDGHVKEVLRLLIENRWSGPVSIEPHLFRLGKLRGWDGIGQFRAALAGFNECFA